MFQYIRSHNCLKLPYIRSKSHPVDIIKIRLNNSIAIGRN